MARVHGYKRFENSLVAQVKGVVFSVCRVIGLGFKKFFDALTRQYTIVLIPHSEKNVHNFRLSFLTVFCFILFMGSIIGAFVWSGLSYSSAQGSLAIKDSRLKDAQASLDSLREGVGGLSKQAQNFQAALSQTLTTLGIDIENQASGDSGDLASFFNIQETAAGSLREVNELQNLANYLASVEEPIREIGALLSTQSTLLTEIPNIWPVEGGKGHISMLFGNNDNPFTGLQYIHKGIDISTYRTGDPVLATADGQVVSYSNDNDFGVNIIIKHKHGFYTRYAHLMPNKRVSVGQRVQQGDVIGYIGNTGLTTGPHLHYEVHVGADVVDPYQYLNIRTMVAGN